MSLETSQKIYVICVDDESDILEIMTDVIKKWGYIPLCFSTINEAQLALQTYARDTLLIISDFRFNEKVETGFDFRRSILSYKDVPFVMISGYINRDMALEAVELKIDGFFEKPLDPDKFLEQIQKICKARLVDIEETRLIEATFLEEANGLVEDLEKQLYELESTQDRPAVLNHIFRLVHTLKGSSAVLPTTVIKDYAHGYEEFLKKLQANPEIFAAAHSQLLFTGLDTIQNLLASYRKGEVLVAVATDIFNKDLQASSQDTVIATEKKSITTVATTQEHADEARSVRVPLEVLDHIEHLTAEVTIQRNMIAKTLGLLQKAMPLNPLLVGLGSHFSEMSKMQAVIQANVAKVRTVSFSEITRPLNRIVRDLERKLGKKARLEISGGEIRVDHDTEAVFSQCFIHLVRNSFDHGIEDATTRIGAGKPEQGHIHLGITENMERYVVTIADDGRGINRDKIKAKAIEKNIITNAEAERLTDQQILQLIFAPGFSTAEKVTEVSGRGVGTDMVKTAVEEMGGELKINSIFGKGSEIKLFIPKKNMSVSIDTVQVRCSARSFVIPRENIYRLLSAEMTPTKHFHSLEGGFQLEVDGEILVLASLNSILSFTPQGDDPKQLGRDIVVCMVKGKKFAIAVDEIIDSEEIVVRPLPAFTNSKQYFKGGALLDDGQVGLVLDIAGFATKLGVDHVVKASLDSTLVGKSRVDSAIESFLLVESNDGQNCAIRQGLISRLEEYQPTALQQSGEDILVLNAGRVMPLTPLNLQTAFNEVAPGERLKSLCEKAHTVPVLIRAGSDKNLVGYTVNRIIDIATVSSREILEQNTAQFIRVQDILYRVVNLGAA